MDLALYPTDDADSFTKVGLRMPRRVHQWHEHLALPLTLLQHVVLHDGQAAAITMLGAQPLEDPLRDVTLLRWTALIILQDLIDDADERVQLRPGRRAATPVSGRNRESQHLRYSPRVDPETSRRLTTAQTLNPHRMSDLPVKLHALHPSALCTQCKELSPEAFLLRRNQTLRPLQ